jgi:ATP-dependent protease ClpP protease subunit
MYNQPLTALDIQFPAMTLNGTVDYGMYNYFRNGLYQLPLQGLVIIELSTLGGDPEVARMMGEDIRYMSDLHPDRRIVFLGKTAVYSAGVTFMSFFARENRYLRRGTRLMIHERLITKTIHVEGPLTTCVASLKATLHEIESSIEIQNEGFENLVLGSSVTLQELIQRAPENWYLKANEAAELGLVEAVL